MTKNQQDPADSSRRRRQVCCALLMAFAFPVIGFAEGTTDSIVVESTQVEGASVPAPLRVPGPGQAPPETLMMPVTMTFVPTIEMAALPAVESPDYEMEEEDGMIGSLAGGIGAVRRTLLPWIESGRESAGLMSGLLIESVTGEDADTAETLSLVDIQGF